MVVVLAISNQINSFVLAIIYRLFPAMNFFIAVSSNFPSFWNVLIINHAREEILNDCKLLYLLLASFFLGISSLVFVINKVYLDLELSIEAP